MARTSPPWELVSVYKLTGLPSRVPKDCFCTPRAGLEEASCAGSRPQVKPTRTNAAKTMRRGIMARSVLRNRTGGVGANSGGARCRKARSWHLRDSRWYHRVQQIYDETSLHLVLGSVAATIGPHFERRWSVPAGPGARNRIACGAAAGRKERTRREARRSAGRG